MKNSLRNKLNLIFSCFLVIGYIVCTYFFSNLAKQVGGETGSLIQVLILVLFGLLIFYATRVGEGKQVKRFSAAVLVLLVLPCAYIIAASFVSALPFHEQLTPVTALAETGKSAMYQPVILMLACIGLGYGIPYTFLSGYELKTQEEVEVIEATGETAAEETAEEETLLEGGIAAELAEAEAEDAVAEAEDAAAKAEEAAAEATEEIADESAKDEENKE